MGKFWRGGDGGGGENEGGGFTRRDVVCNGNYLAEFELHRNLLYERWRRGNLGSKKHVNGNLSCRKCRC